MSNTNHQSCQLINSVLWNETVWALALVLENLNERLPKKALALSSEDFTIGLEGEYGDKDYSNNCYEESAQQALEKLVVLA